MSRHWQPDGDRTRWTRADGYVPPAPKSGRAKSWPQGATAGLMLVAAGCLAIGLLLYKSADRGYEIEKNAALDWNAVELAGSRD